jgi:hypothetical protein
MGWNKRMAGFGGAERPDRPIDPRFPDEIDFHWQITMKFFAFSRQSRAGSGWTYGGGFPGGIGG